MTRKIKFQDILDALKRDKIIPDIIIHGIIDKPPCDSEKDWEMNPIMKTRSSRSISRSPTPTTSVIFATGTGTGRSM